MTILALSSQEGFEPLVQPFLAGKGHALLFAVSSEEAIGRARTERVDLIVMDLDMAVGDGLRTLKELKNAAETMLTPVIIVARSSAAIRYLEELSKSVKEDAVAIVGEPGDLTRLDEMVGRVFGEASSGSGCLTDETLSKLTDGELSAEESERARSHLSWCADCQRRYEEWGRTDAELRDLFRAALLGKRRSGECLTPWQLAGYLRGQLSAEERGRVESHLLLCSSCMRELVTLHELLQEFDDEEPAPLSEEVVSRLEARVGELVSRERSPLICIRCLGSIPLDSDACPRCGAVVGRRERGEKTGAPPVRWFGTRAGKIAASLVGLSLAASVVLGGIGVYQNRRPDVLAVTADNVLAERLLDEIEEEIEVLGQVAMPEPRPGRFEVPENVDRIARALVGKYYYDESVAAKALRHKDIEDVFKTLNRLETKGAKSKLLPKFPNRILSPSELNLLKSEMSGEFAGIGVSVRRAPGGRGEEIVGFTPNSAAKEAGLQLGDIITEVDGMSLRGLKLAEMVAMLRGPVNAPVRLIVARQAVPDFGLWIPRKRSRVPFAITHGLLGPNTAYVSVHGLVGDAVKDLEKVLAQFKSSHVERVVLDLRGNTGGSVQTATELAGLFLQSGTPIARIEPSDAEDRFSEGSEATWEGALAVLVDRQTVSSGELVAAALQGTRRAVVVGERTAGKGSIQTVYRLANGYGVQATTNTLSGPDGFIINKQGIEPDVEITRMQPTEFPRQLAEVTIDRVVEAGLKALDRTPVAGEKGLRRR